MVKSEMSEVFQILSKDFVKLTEDSPKLTEVLNFLSEPNFQLSKRPPLLSEQAMANVRTPIQNAY
ncbi:hypothetical protein [Sutcliffiella horikoshii]|uniref:hypothetical protein n=1 Tax=Sutcliffiella horikoshii TaxID=79883 RepID=UPI001F2DED4F|nr:hypothetical protein [Sutcliffiella horikoshii]